MFLLLSADYRIGARELRKLDLDAHAASRLRGRAATLAALRVGLDSDDADVEPA